MTGPDRELVAKKLARIETCGFRNVLVHGYESVDLAVVEDIARSRLDDLLAFASAVRERIGPR